MLFCARAERAVESFVVLNALASVAVAAFGGIKVAKSLHLFKQATISIKEILSSLTLPVFVKPNNGGSSIPSQNF